MEKINSFREEYYFLSNFYEVPITYDGITYENNEAAFQAQKCVDQKDRLSFSKINASEAKKLGRHVSLRKDWEDIKVSIMENIVLAKFEQHPDLAQKLLHTGDQFLEEGNTWGDRIWGTVDGQGRNLLGYILMHTRDILKSKMVDKEISELDL